MTRLSRRHLLWTGATAAAGALLAACAGPTPQPAAPTTASGSAPSAAPSSGNATATATLKFWWHHGGDIGKAVEAVNAEFQKRNPTIKIEGLQVSDVGTKVNTALAGGNPPDLWDADMGTLAYASKGALLALDPYLSGSPVKLDDYPQKTMMVWQGKTYALPAVESGMENALLWNKKLFREAGLDPDKPPQTWAELLDAAAKLTKTDSSGNFTQLGFNNRDSSAGMWPNWLTIEAILVYDPDKQKVSFTQPEQLDLVQRLVDYEKKLDPAKVGAFTKTYPTWGSVTPGGAFSTEKEAMMIDGSWAPGGLASLAPNIEVGYTWCPTKSGTVKSQQMGSHQFGAYAQTKAPDAAWKLVEFLATDGNQMIYDASGSFAYNKPFAAKVDTSKWKGLKWYFDSVSQASFVRPRGYLPNGPDAWGKWWAAMDDLVFGRATSAKDTLAKAEQETQDLLDKMLKGG